MLAGEVQPSGGFGEAALERADLARLPARPGAAGVGVVAPVHDLRHPHLAGGVRIDVDEPLEYLVVPLVAPIVRATRAIFQSLS